MSRNGRGTLIICLAVTASLTGTAPAQLVLPDAPVPLQDGKLYLNVGTVDTTRLGNLLPATAARSRTTGGTPVPQDSAAAFRRGRPHVVQLAGPMTPDFRAALGNAGVVLGDYLPKNAYVADLDGVNAVTLSKLGFVSWVGEFQNGWKLDPAIGERPHRTPQRQTMAERGEAAVILTLFKDKPLDEVLDALAAVDGAEVHYAERVGGNETLSVSMPLAAVPGLAELSSVQYIEEAPELTLRNNTTRWIVQTNVSNVTSVWDHGIRGYGQIVAIMDSKLDRNHCSFMDPVNNTPGPNHRKIAAYNTSYGSYSHGTHVSGTAVGQDYNGSTGSTRGMAYEGRLVFDDVPSYNESAMRAVLIQHNGQGAHIHTNSWGDDGTTSYNSLCRGIDSFSYDYEDDLVLFAVTNTSTLRNPENAKNVLAVAASQDTPNQNNHCRGGIGPTADGRRKPEIYAPGCSTNSSRSGTACSTSTSTGTSMASPAVAGTALLVRQYYVDGFYPTGTANPPDGLTPSGALIKATLLNSAVDMTGISGYPSSLEGWGRVLIENALYFTGDDRGLAILDDLRNAQGRSTGQFVDYPLNVLSSSEKLKVTLVWTDPPASANTGTGFAAINDLDLVVTSPGGTQYRGNVFSGGVSVPGGTADDRNNVEQVHINAPQTGAWTVRVWATAVNQGLQGYALIATGGLQIADCSSPGDLTGDGGVRGDDIGLFVDCFLGGAPSAPGCACADMNRNSTFEPTDIDLFVECLVRSICP